MRYIAKVLSIERRLRIMAGQFNRQSNDGPQEANWEGWTPPWMAHEGHEGHGPGGWQGPRGTFGFGHGWGHRGWKGPRRPFGFGSGRCWGAPAELLALRAQAAEVVRSLMLASTDVCE